jgi:hypothetical protein
MRKPRCERRSRAFDFLQTGETAERFWAAGDFAYDGLYSSRSGVVSASSILKLQAAGFTAEQVTAIADLIDTQSATRADVEATEHRLDARIEGVEHRLESRMAEGFHNFDLKIQTLDRKIDLLEEKLGKKIVEAKYDTTKWLIGAIGFQALVIIGTIVGAVAAIIRFAPASGH